MAQLNVPDELASIANMVAAVRQNFADYARLVQNPNEPYTVHVTIPGVAGSSPILLPGDLLHVDPAIVHGAVSNAIVTALRELAQRTSNLVTVVEQAMHAPTA